MRGIGNERKVRCHKEPVENPLARLATRASYEKAPDPTGTSAAIPARAVRGIETKLIEKFAS